MNIQQQYLEIIKMAQSKYYKEVVSSTLIMIMLTYMAKAAIDDKIFLTALVIFWFLLFMVIVAHSFKKYDSFLKALKIAYKKSLPEDTDFSKEILINITNDPNSSFLFEGF